MGIRKYVVVILCLGLCGCSTLMNRMPAPVIQEKDMIYEVKPGTTLDLYYGGQKLPTTLNESWFLVTEDFLISMASDHTTAILKKVKAKKDSNIVMIIIGIALALFASLAGVALVMNLKNLIPKKLTFTTETK